MKALNISELKTKFHEFYPDKESINVPWQTIEEKLGVVLPDDWKEISSFYTGEMLGPIWIYAPSYKGPADNIVEETLRLRSPKSSPIPLPHQYIVLLNDSPSCIVMETQISPDKPSPIIYCNELDFYNLCQNKPLQHKPKIFPCFAEFFRYLLSEAEAERKSVED